MDRSERLRVFGWVLLVGGLPLALLAASLPVNEYRVTLGIDALDCDGPIGIYIFAVPASLIYVTGFVANVRHWRRPLNLLVALLCLVICVPVALNVVRAGAEEARTAEACAAR